MNRCREPGKDHALISLHEMTMFTSSSLTTMLHTDQTFLSIPLNKYTSVSLLGMIGLPYYSLAMDLILNKESALNGVFFGRN